MTLEELKQINKYKNNLNLIKKDFFDFAWDNDYDLDPRLSMVIITQNFQT